MTRTAPPPPRYRTPPRYRMRRTLGVLLGVLMLLGGLAVATRFLLHGAGLVDVEQVEVTERVPVAVTDTAGGPFLVDSTGLPYRSAPAGTPLPRLIAGSAGHGDPATTAGIAVLTALPEPVRAQVLTVGVSGTGQVTLGLAGARQVRWGSLDRSPEKVAVLAPLLTRPGAVYDVTSPDLPTVRS